MTYQTVSGTVNAGAHPGSYNGQDAYNDMLVTNNEMLMERRTDSTDAFCTQCGGGAENA